MTDPKSNNSPATLFQPGWREDAPRTRRRTGSRAKLAKRFFEDTYTAWEEQGESALARAAFHDPMGFVSMVARLMPQKIEVSTPTDGMSDERLAEMLDMAERMARLRAGNGATVIEGSTVVAALPLAHELADENGPERLHAEEGGGGPLGLGGAWGVNTPHTFTAEPSQIAKTPYNKVCTSDSTTATAHDRNCSSCATPLQVHEIELCERCGAPAALPYPVGRPFPKPDHVVERANRAALAEEDIDPASLF